MSTVAMAMKKAPERKKRIKNNLDLHLREINGGKKKLLRPLKFRLSIMNGATIIPFFSFPCAVEAAHQDSTISHSIRQKFFFFF